MSAWYQTLAPAQAAAVLCLAVILMAAATTILSVSIVQCRRFWQRSAELRAALKQTELETSLKQELLAHGLTPAEIKQVIEATSADLVEI